MDADHYHCPQGERLALHRVDPQGRVAVYRAPASACAGCPAKARCTPHAEGRHIYRPLAAWTETDATRGVRPMIAAGIGQRISLGESVAITARVGGNLYAERVMVDGSPQTKAMGFWTVRLGLSFYFGGGQ